MSFCSTLRATGVFAVAATTFACSSSKGSGADILTGPPTPAATSTAPVAPPTVVAPSTTTTWTDGKQIPSPVTIEAGATVTIAPGATVTLAAGAFITVKGTLTAESSANHAKLTADAWGGIVVAGGTVALKGVELNNATAALDVQGGTAAFDDGVIAWASTPFRIAEGTTLSMTGTNVTHAQGLARVRGTLNASNMDFETIGDDGIVVDTKDGVINIQNSKLHGQGPPTDMIVAFAGSLALSHVDITGVHCGLHLWNADAINISYLSSHDNVYGAMLYGSTGSSLAIANSNFENNTGFGIEEQTGSVNGALTLSGCYIGGNGTDTQLLPKTNIIIASPATAAVAGAGTP